LSHFGGLGTTYDVHLRLIGVRSSNGSNSIDLCAINILSFIR